MPSRRLLLAALCAQVALPAVFGTPLKTYTSVVVFGDSLSDNGNGAWTLSNHTWPADPAYSDGRFSNGPVLADQLPALVGATKLIDLAYGGATINNSIIQGFTGPGSTIPVPSVVDQVSTFLQTRANETQPRTTLALLLAGVNDAFFASQGVDVRALTDSLAAAVAALAARGFRAFVLPRTQPGALLPYYVLYTDAAAVAAQDRFSAEFAGNLTLSLRAARLRVHLWDERAAIARAVEAAEARGLEGETPCLRGAYGEEPERALCADAGRHVFFDAFHPTTETHGQLARSIVAALRD